jgi:hypothetical protein
MISIRFKLLIFIASLAVVLTPGWRAGAEALPPADSLGVYDSLDSYKNASPPLQIPNSGDSVEVEEDNEEETLLSLTTFLVSSYCCFEYFYLIRRGMAYGFQIPYPPARLR